MRRAPARAVRVAAAAIVVLACGCGDAALKAAGEPCVASSECAAGLVCDLVAPAHVCTEHVTTDAHVIDAPIDAFLPLDAGTDAAIDAAVDAAALQAPGL